MTEKRMSPTLSPKEGENEAESDRARALAYLLEVGIVPAYAARKDPVGALISSHQRLRVALKAARSSKRVSKG